MPSGYPHSRATRRELFDRVCLGDPLERAAKMMGVSTTAATLWWRHAGAMPLHRGQNAEGTHGLVEPGDLDRPGGRGHRLSIDERVEIMRGLDAGLSYAQMGASSTATAVWCGAKWPRTSTPTATTTP